MYKRQLKRLEIARALAMKPRLIFLDEPAAGLNPKETIEVDALVRKVADSGVTVVLVAVSYTHLDVYKRQGRGSVRACPGRLVAAAGLDIPGS